MLISITKKVCSNPNCEFKYESQPVSNFTKSKKGRDGYYSQCKKCVGEYNKKYKVTHKEEIQKYESENRQVILDKTNRCRQRSAYYDSYASKLEKYEKVRRDSDNPKFLQVECSYCHTWMKPKK